MRKQDQNMKTRMYKIGAWAALIAAFIFRRNLDAEYYLFHELGIFAGSISSAPDTAIGWIHLMNNQPFLGLTLLNMFDLLNIALVGFTFISVIIVLWHKNSFVMGITAFLTVSAIVYFFITNQSITIYQLSQEMIHMDANQQSMAIIQVDSLLRLHYSNHYSPGSIYPSYLLISLAGLLISIQMLKSDIFTKTCAWMGILANGIALSYWGFHFLLPELEFIAPAFSAVFLLIWYILIGIQLLKHAKSLSAINNQT